MLRCSTEDNCLNMIMHRASLMRVMACGKDINRQYNDNGISSKDRQMVEYMMSWLQQGCLLSFIIKEFKFKFVNIAVPKNLETELNNA